MAEMSKQNEFNLRGLVENVCLPQDCCTVNVKYKLELRVNMCKSMQNLQ